MAATSQADSTKSATVTVVVTTDAVLEVSGTYGSYSSAYGTTGDLTLFQAGSAITGTWGHPQGNSSVSGTLTGRVFSGSWKRLDGANSGLFVVTFAVDGQSYSGTWGIGTSNSGYTWTGTRKAGVGIQINPGSSILTPGDTQDFTVLVAGDFDKSVTWTTTGGTINGQGVYTATSTPGVYSVTATANADSTKSATVTVVVTTDAVLEVSGTYGSYSSAYGTTGDLTLFQAGSAITGTWGHPQGNSSVSGTLTGRVFSGSWKRLDGANSGLFVVTFAVDGQSYSGTWGIGTSNSGYTWTGTRKAGVGIQINPGSSILTPGDTQDFTVLVAGDFDKSVTWTTTGGTINGQGVYTAPSTPGIYSVTATANADFTKSATVTVVVTTDAVLEVSGTYGSYSSAYGTTGDLTLFQAGSAITGTWGHPQGNSSVSGTLTGRVFSGSWKRLDGANSGLFVVTFAVDGQSYSGTWGIGTSNSGYTWTGTRKADVGIQINPGSSILTPGDTQDFTVLVAGDFDKSVTWTTTGGTINGQGVYTAPSTPGIYSVTATANADFTKSATVTVVVTTDAVLEVSGTYGSYSSAYGTTGDLTLFQAGSAITGTWGHPQGNSSVSGTLTGRVFSGNWKRLDGGNSGLFVVTFAVDGQSYSGTWGYGTSNSSYTWTGTRKAGVVTVSVIPDTQPIIAPGDTQPFQALVGGIFDKRVVWSSSAGTITADGRFTAPTLPGQNRYTVTAISAVDPTKWGTVSVLVAPGGVAFISGKYTLPYSGTLVLYQNGTTVTGDLASGSWGDFSLQGTLNGYVLSGTTTNKANGVVQVFSVTFAPDVNSFTGSVGYWGSGWTGTRQVGVVVLRMSPLGARIIQPNTQVQYVVEVAGNPDTSLTWTATAGMVVDGLYTAPPASAYSTQTITATSNADPTKKISAQVTITPTGYLFVSGRYTLPYSGTLVLYQNGTTVTGDLASGSWGDFSLQGTLNGYVLSGTTTNKANGVVQVFSVTFAPDVNSFTGSVGYWGSGWTGTRQVGVVVLRMSPLGARIIQPNTQVQYVVEVAGNPDTSLTWTATAGMVVDGLYTAPPASAYSTQTITATSNADPTKKISAQVTITPTGYLFVSGRYTLPYSGTLVLYQNGTTVTGDLASGSWGDFSLQGTLNGYVLSGTTTNKANGVVQVFSVTFTPDVNSFTGSVGYWGSGWTGTRQPGVIAIKFTHAPTSMSLADSAQFSADVTGTLDMRVEFSTTMGSITADGVFTSSTPGTAIITAKSLADPTKTATAKILVTDGNPANSLVARWKFEEGGGPRLWMLPPTSSTERSTTILLGSRAAWARARLCSSTDSRPTWKFRTTRSSTLRASAWPCGSSFLLIRTAATTGTGAACSTRVLFMGRPQRMTWSWKSTAPSRGIQAPAVRIAGGPLV